MATYSGEAIAAVATVAYVKEKTSVGLNSAITKPSSMGVDFTWAPTVGTFRWTVEGVTYPYEDAPASISKGVEVMFTATVDLPPGRSIDKFEWDFGDGNTEVGNPATNTFAYASNHVRVSLIVTDDLGQKTAIGHQMYIV